MFPKQYVSRDTKMSRNVIIAPKTLLTIIITQKTTKMIARFKLVMFMGLEQNKTSTTKDSKMIIGRWGTMEALLRGVMMDDGKRSVVDSVYSS